MCAPQLLAVAGFAVSAASTVVGFMGQQAQANAQDAAWKQNYTNALAAARDDQNQMTARQVQEADASSLKQHQQDIAVAQKQAEVSVQAASGGVSGISVDSLLNDVSREGDLNKLSIQRNFEATVTQLQKEKDATNNTALNRINSMSPGQHPNPLAAGLNIASAGFGAYNDYQKSQQPSPVH